MPSTMSDTAIDSKENPPPALLTSTSSPAPTRPPLPPSSTTAMPTFDPVNSRLTFKASLLSYLFHQLRTSPTSPSLPILPPAPAPSSSPSSSPPAPRPIDLALTQLLFLQQYFSCLSAHLRAMSPPSPSPPSPALSRLHAERDAYFQLIASVVGLVTAAPVIPNSASFITVPLASITAPKPPPSPAPRPPSPARTSPRPRSTSSHPSHTRFQSSPGISLHASRPVTHRAPTLPYRASAIYAPPHATFTHGRWQSLTPSAPLDPSVSDVDAIEDWGSSPDPPQPAPQPPADVSTPAYKVELGDVDDESLDISRVAALKERQWREQSKVMSEVQLINGRWQSTAHEVADELDGIADLDEAEGAVEAAQSSAPVVRGSSTTSAASTPRSSLASGDLQSALDEMSEDGDSRLTSRRSSAASTASSARSGVVSKVHSRQPSGYAGRGRGGKRVGGGEGEADVVNLSEVVIRDEDVQGVEDVSEAVEAAVHDRADLVTEDELEDMSDFMVTLEDEPLPVPVVQGRSAPSPSKAGKGEKSRSEEELKEFEVGEEWKEARRREEREYAGTRRSLFGKAAEVHEVTWGELLQFAEQYHERDGSELDDITQMDDFTDDEALEGKHNRDTDEDDEDMEDEEGGEEDGEEEEEEDDDIGDDAISGLKAKLAKQGSAISAEDVDDADWGDEG